MSRKYILFFVNFAWLSINAMDTATSLSTSPGPRILFEDLDSGKKNNTVTLLTHDGNYGFEIDKERVKLSLILKYILEECKIRDNTITLSQDLQDHNLLFRFFRYLYCTHEQLQQRLKKHDSPSLVALTILSNRFSTPSIFEPCCSQLHTYVRTCMNQTQTVAEQTVGLLTHMPADIKHIVLNAIKEKDKIHFYWLKLLYSKPDNRTFFLNPETRKTHHDYETASEKEILYVGTNPHEHVEGSKIFSIGEFKCMRDKLNLMQFLLLLYAKNKREQGQPLQLTGSPLLLQALSTLPCEKLKALINQTEN